MHHRREDGVGDEAPNHQLSAAGLKTVFIGTSALPRAARAMKDRLPFVAVTVYAALGSILKLASQSRGQAFIPFVRNDRQQLLEPFAPLRSRNTELCQMRPQRIDHLGGR
jgi:hypothetical protein